MRFLREMQMPCKWVSLSIGVLLGYLQGFHLLGSLREKSTCVHFLDPEDIKILSLGAICNFSTGTRLS
jgi:hypothetical protein